MHARRQGEEPMGSRTVPAVPRRNLGGSCSVCTPEREPFVESRSVLSILVGAVVSRLTDFFDALNNSSPLVIKRFFAPAPKFEWYSVTEGGGVDDRWRERPTFDRSRLLLGPNGRGRHFVTYDPASLQLYLAQRQGQHERMSLLVLDVGEQRGPPHPEAGIAYVVRRAADDLDEVGITKGLAQGKGAIDCDSGRIFAWSMAMEGSPASWAHETLKMLCPAPSAGAAVDVVVACARGRGPRRAP